LTDVRKRQLAWVAGISAVIAFLAVWTFAIDWEWSTIGDDVAWVNKYREATSSGEPAYWLAYLWQLIASDTTGWGLFRPAYHLYGLVVYPLGADIAHGLRLLMFLTVLAAPIVVAFRELKRSSLKWLAAAWLLALSFSAYSMVYGTYLVSLQELTGMFFVALGLLSHGRAGRAVFWLLAAWTKAPFIWLYLAFGTRLLFARKRLLAIVVLSVSLISLLVMSWSSLTGGYTQGRLNISPWHIWMNVQSLGSYGAAFFIVTIVGLLLFARNLSASPESLVMVSGATLYAINLLPWNTIGYYNAPVWYLLICGFALMFKKSPNYEANKTQATIAGTIIGVCLTGAISLTLETVRTDVIGKNTMVVQARDWVLQELPRDKNFILYELTEYEFDFLLREKDPTWSAPETIRWFVNQPQPPETLDYEYVIANTEYPIPEEITKCPPIKVWTRGFLAPLKC